MGLIADLTLVLTDISKFFQFCTDFFQCLPLAIRILIYFVFGGFLLFGLFRIVMKAGD